MLQRYSLGYPWIRVHDFCGFAVTAVGSTLAGAMRWLIPNFD